MQFLNLIIFFVFTPFTNVYESVGLPELQPTHPPPPLNQTYVRMVRRDTADEYDKRGLHDFPLFFVLFFL